MYIPIWSQISYLCVHVVGRYALLLNCVVGTNVNISYACKLGLLADSSQFKILTLLSNLNSYFFNTKIYLWPLGLSIFYTKYLPT